MKKLSLGSFVLESRCEDLGAGYTFDPRGAGLCRSPVTFQSLKRLSCYVTVVDSDLILKCISNDTSYLSTSVDGLVNSYGFKYYLSKYLLITISISSYHCS